MSQSHIEKLIVQPQFISSLPTDDQVEEHQHKLIRHLETLKDNHHQDDINWFQRLIYNNRENIESEDIDLGILYNLTYLDAITAKLLDIDPRKIIKAAIVKRYIRELWQDNNQPKEFLESHILNDNNSRNLIETILRPSDTSELAHNESLTITTETPNQELNTIDETEVPEVEMVQESVQDISENNENKEENYNQALGRDINTISCYETRNRPYQTINPFYITKNGKFTAGTLIGNTPGDTKTEQTKYLSNILKLSTYSNDLIQTTFHNGNGWYIFNFEYASDLKKCIDKINKKDNENFRIIALNNSDSKKKRNTLETSNLLKKENTNNNHSHKRKQQENSSQGISITNQQPSKSKIQEKTNSKGKGKFNNYNIIENTSNYQLRIRCTTIPGNNRGKQLQNLAETLQIPLESDLIQITCIGKSKLAILNFENSEDMWICQRNLITQFPSCDTFTSKENLDQDTYLPQDPSLIVVRVTDIPIDFSTQRIKGAIQKYGKITDLKITKGNNNFKTATISFDKLKLDLKNTWAIPMGDIMARITLLDDWENTLIQRNTITTRLYGINNSTSATRIMSAIKHLKAKTVHIPRNSKTDKRRRFAIIGFSSQEDLQQALASYVSLFDTKTWWSTKDNQKLNNKRKQEYNIFSSKSNNDNDDDDDDNMSTLSTSNSSQLSHLTTARREHLNTQTKSYRKEYKNYNETSKNRKQYTSTTEASLISISTTLQDIAKRLNKLEGKEKRSRLPNRS
jgi:hypothetical protein